MNEKDKRYEERVLVIFNADNLLIGYMDNRLGEEFINTALMHEEIETVVRKYIDTIVNLEWCPADGIALKGYDYYEINQGYKRIDEFVEQRVIKEERVKELFKERRVKVNKSEDGFEELENLFVTERYTY